MTKGVLPLPVPVGGTGPWFRRQPRLAIAVAGVLFVAIFVWRLSVAGTEDAITVLYALPVALVAVAFGFRYGLGAGAGAVALIETWVALRGVTLTPMGWLTRTIPMLLLGTLLGLACDRLDEAYRRDEQLRMIIAFQREAAEINDTIVQGMAAAKWALEAGDMDTGLDMLTETIVQAQSLVSSMLGSASPLPGDLRRSRPVQPAA